MPSRPIQGLAPGLLSVLGLKNLGRLPDTLLDEVRPGFDLVKWLLNGSAQNRQQTQGFAVAWSGASAPIIVPDDEAWYVHSLSTLIVLPVALASYNVLSYGALVNFPSPGANLLGETVTYANSATLGIASGWLAAPSVRDFFCPPGTTLGWAAGGIDIQDGVGVNFSVFTTVRFSPMQV